MVEIVIYIYFALNLLSVGFYLGDVFNDSSKLNKIKDSFLLFFFGVILATWFYFAPKIRIITWIKNEIAFKYRFYFTDYWDKILLDDDYSEDFPTLAEKLKQAEKFTSKGSKQLKRHNKIIQEKYAPN